MTKRLTCPFLLLLLLPPLLVVLGVELMSSSAETAQANGESIDQSNTNVTAVTPSVDSFSENAATAPPTKKTVFLIRHAESEENRRLASLGRVVKALTKFKLPAREDRAASVELLDVGAQLDSDVSPVGRQQIAHMGDKLKQAGFVDSSNMTLVAHSQLTRAKETSKGLLGCLAPDTKAGKVTRVEELEILNEKEVKEWIPTMTKQFKQRIADFELWLAEQPDETVAVVGHSQYFRAMLGLDFRFHNCDVWQVTFDAAMILSTDSVQVSEPGKPDEGEEAAAEALGASNAASFKLLPQWSDLKQLYGCEIKGSKEESVL